MKEKLKRFLKVNNNTIFYGLAMVYSIYALVYSTIVMLYNYVDKEGVLIFLVVTILFASIGVVVRRIWYE
jgi:hypothetical protein